MSKEKLREIAAKGGRTAHARGVANKFDAVTGSAAGRIPHEKGTAYKWSPEEAAEAGRKGGRAVHRRKQVEE